MTILCILALLAATTLASWAWCLGFSKGYALCEKHGRETAIEDARSLGLWPATIVSAPLNAREMMRAIVSELDRTRDATVGPNGRRADAWERI